MPLTDAKLRSLKPGPKPIKISDSGGLQIVVMPNGSRLWRLAEARQRLEAGADDLALLAVQTGFSSHAHLTTAFGHAFGLTPQAYRRRLSGLAAPD
jgi:hypothetical protein